MKNITYINNKFIDHNKAKISVDDRGFLFADSVYELISVLNKKIIDLDQHLNRLKVSLRKVKIKYKLTRRKEEFINNEDDELSQDVKETFKKLLDISSRRLDNLNARITSQDGKIVMLISFKILNRNKYEMFEKDTSSILSNIQEKTENNGLELDLDGEILETLYTSVDDTDGSIVNLKFIIGI